LEAGDLRLSALTQEQKKREIENLSLEIEELNERVVYRQERLETPQLRLQKADEETRSIGFKVLPNHIQQEYLDRQAGIKQRHFTEGGKQEDDGITNHNIHTINVDLACISVFLRNATGTASEGTHLFESFLQMRFREDQSKYLKELESMRRQLQRLKKFEFTTDGLSEDSAANESHRSCASRIFIPDTWCFNIWGCFHNAKAVEPHFESCRSYVKFHVTFQTTVIAIAQVAYAALIYLNHEGHISHGFLGIPLGFMVLAIQAIILIPCYTKTDSTKAKQITLNLLDNYTENTGHIAAQIAGLAQQEKFMEELEDIGKDTRSATAKVKAFDTDFARAFELIMAIYTSLRKTEKEQYMIRPEIDPTDGTLLLIRRAIHHAPTPRLSNPDKLPRCMEDLSGHNQQDTADTDEWQYELESAQRRMTDAEEESASLSKQVKLLTEREQKASMKFQTLEQTGSANRTAAENKEFRAAWNEKEDCKESLEECKKDLMASQKAMKTAAARIEKASSMLGIATVAVTSAVPQDQASERIDSYQGSYHEPPPLSPSRIDGTEDSIRSPLVQDKNTSYGSGPF